MRLWSLHPKYLDRMGLLAVWREGLLAQSVLLDGEFTNCLKCFPYPEIGEVEIDGVMCDRSYDYVNPDCPRCKGTGKIKTPYWNHPQLNRFKEKGNRESQLITLGYYLWYIYDESVNRGYSFNRDNIRITGFRGIGLFEQSIYFNQVLKLKVTRGQLEYEFFHLQNKLKTRDNNLYWDNENEVLTEEYCNLKNDHLNIEPHPLFKVIEGDTEPWEKI